MKSILSGLSLLFLSLQTLSAQDLGLFEGNLDIGDVQHSGSVVYDAAANTYTITGGGENMWFDKDDFHFLWKKASGDISIAADITILPSDEGANDHRKGVLMIRKDLDDNSAYADVALHGNGLTSLQYRVEKGGVTQEVQSNVTGPSRIRIEKKGDTVTLQVAGKDEPLASSGASAKISLEGEVYIGLGVLAHDNTRKETVVFSNVVVTMGSEISYGEEYLESTLERINIGNTDRRVVYHTRGHFEAPNWSRDGSYMLFNMEGNIYKIPAEGGEPEMLDMGFANRANNDHGISPDGTMLVISDGSQLGGGSRMYTLPIEGGVPTLITPKAPSYWHGWSPDGKTLAYVADRGGDYDIYTIPVEGGEETRLTDAKGLDDGPDYSPDGKYIWFNSVRTGTMQIYRMNADGSDEQQITDDKYNDWFPHPSPDGKWIVFLSYGPEVEGHPANKDVMLRLMPAEGGEAIIIAKLFGGQGTINVPSWSPDSQYVAFVSYRLGKN